MGQAENLYNRNRIDQAAAQWREVLRLDPGNVNAAEGLNAILVSAARQALVRFSGVNSIDDVADALDNRTDDEIAQRLLVACRTAIQEVDGSYQRAPDPAMYDDLENFIDSNGLGIVVSAREDGSLALPSTERLYGRQFLRELSPWLDRARLQSHVHVELHLPFGTRGAANRLKLCTFQIQSDGIDIDGAGIGPDVSLRAIYEDGDWRIAPRAGFRLMCTVSASYSVHGADPLVANPGAME